MKQVTPGAAYWGARITLIAGDGREVRVRLPLSRRTRNHVGVIFGGSLCYAVDLADRAGEVHASCETLLSVRPKPRA